MSKKPGLMTEEKQKIKNLLAMGKTYHAIAKEIGRDAKTIKKYATRPEASIMIRERKQELADWYEELAKRMLSSITDNDIERINAYQRTVSAGIATDKMRLLKDQSTENISTIVAIIQQIKEQREG